MEQYHGSCHCQAVQYDVTVSLEQTVTCNCSMCKKAGYILAFTRAEQFTLLQGQNSLTSYTFNKGIIDHLFCSVCGIKSFSRGKDEQGNATIAVNVRCLDGVDVSTLSSLAYDGASA